MVNGVRKRKYFGLFFFVALWLLAGMSACSSSPPPPPPPPERVKDLDASILNYTDDNIGQAYVDGDWVGSMGHHLGGGSIAGGAEVPYHWRPDFKLRVAWQTDALFEKNPDLLDHRMVALEPYADHDGGILWVTFLPHGVIKLYVSAYYPGNPHWPGKLENPTWQCWTDNLPNCPGHRPD